MYRFFKKSYHILFLLAVPFISYAQVQHAMFERLSVDQGLSQSQVMSLCQDSQGFMWIGTRNGLNRYDGYTFVHFKKIKEDSSSISDNLINALFVDRDSTLWIGSGNGLNRFDPLSHSFVRYFSNSEDSSTLSNDHIQAIAQDSSGFLWIGTAWGLNRYDPTSGRFKRFYFDLSAPDSADYNRIWDVITSPDGRLVIATDAGVRIFNSESGESTLIQQKPVAGGILEGNRIRKLLFDQTGKLWIGTLGGLSVHDLQKGQVVRHVHQADSPNTVSSEIITTLLEDRSGNVWIGTESGLNRYDPLKDLWTRYFHEPDDPYSLSNNHISAAYESRSGILWFGTFHWGVNKYVPAKQVFQFYRTFNVQAASDFIDYNVLSISQSQDDIFWIGMYGGLFRWDRNRNRIRQYYSESPSSGAPIGHIVTAIEQAPDRTVWIGSVRGERSGLSQYNPRTGTFRHFQHDPENASSLSSNDINVIFFDRDGTLWIGTDGSGLDRYDIRINRFTHYTTDYNDTSRIAGNWINTLLEDHTGLIWIGTDQGISAYNKKTGTFENYLYHPDDPTTLVGQRITALYEDSQYRFWIATEDGLNLMDRETGIFTTYNAVHIAPSAIIYSILEDETVTLWLSTSSGILNFDPESETFKGYDQSDGLHVVDFNGGAAWKTADGELFFGGKSGLISFYPDQIQANDYIPPVVITDFKVINQSLSGDVLYNSTPFRLSYQDRSISFEFVSLDYTSPVKNQYRYKMEGFDSEWIQAGNRRFANYTNLNPNTYTFHVQGSNAYGVWNEAGARVSFKIVPPFWQTVWFQLFIILIAAGIIYAGYRYRLRQHERYEKELKAEVDKRTRELAEANWDLAVSRGEYQRLYDEAPVGYHEVDLDGKILHVNQTEADLLGYSREEMIGRSIFDFIAEEEREDAQSNFKMKVTKEDETSQFERKYVRKGGAPVYFSLITKRVRDKDRQEASIRTALINVTRVKQLEEQLLQSQKMEAIGRLAGGVAHDFNNLLTVLRGHASLLLTEIGPEHPLRNEIESIDRAGEKAEQVTRQLLAFSRKQQLKPEVIQLNDLIVNLKKMLVRLIGEDITLETQLDSQLGLILVDPGQIEQVIMNLAVNARDAMPKGGMLKLETRNEILQESHQKEYPEIDPGQYTLLVVTDTGIGMDEETRNHIFEPFFTTKDKSKGTGLGLPMVYGIIKQSQGHVHVTSEPGRGTSFHIFLPQTEGRSANHKTTKESLLKTEGSETIFILEDDDHVRQFVCRALRRFGYHVLEASDYDSAMTVCKENTGPIHMVLSDVIMPKMNGPEIVQHIEQQYPDIKVLFMSGYNDNIISHHGVLDEGINFIQKPFSLNDLTEKVREVLESE